MISRALIAAALLAFAAPARGDTLGEVRTREGAVRSLEDQRNQLDGNRLRLEREQDDLANEIESTKSRAQGVRRDFRLSELLAASKAKADELERVATELRLRQSAVADARRQLIAACDRALAQPQPEARRLELARLRTAQAALVAMPSAPLGKSAAAPGAPLTIDPLDGPRELGEKADLLRDSEDKLKREVDRLAARIDDVDRRRHLRERAGAVDEDMFGESSSNRRFARVASSGTSASQNPKTSTDGAQGATTGAGGTINTPAPAPGTTGGPPTVGTTGGGGAAPGGVGLGGGSTGGTSGGGGANVPPANNNGPSGSFSGDGTGRGGDTATVLRNLVDPSTLDELRRADGGDDLERQLRALRRAQGELQTMANELERRARSLSTRADELKRKK